MSTYRGRIILKQSQHQKKFSTLFLDRDGVINHKIDGYVQFYSDFIFIDGALESIKRLTFLFDRIIVVTNQQGIGKKIMNLEDLNLLHDKMKIEIENYGGKIDRVYHCPHLSSENCTCRKPNPGMLLKAKEDFPEIDFDYSFLIGDSDSDIKAAEFVGITSVKVSKKYTLNNWCNEFLSD